MIPSFFAWPTRDRPEILQRGLRAWASHLSLLPSPPSLVIADNSLAQGPETRAVVEELSGTYPGMVHYLDQELGASLGTALAGRCGEDAIFALGLGQDPGIALPELKALRYGSGRNLLLLALAGQAFAVTDDDVLPDFRRPRDTEAGIFEAGLDDPTVIHPYWDAAGLDRLSLPSAGLPWEAWDCLDRQAGLAEGALPPAAVLCFGYWGDSGMASSRYLLTHRSAVDADAYEGEGYESALNSRFLLRASPATMVSGRYYMPAHGGLDARGILPPFSPWGRGEDSLWASMFSVLHPDLAMAYVPDAVHHLPPPGRSTGRAEALAGGVYLTDLLQSVVLRGPRSTSYAELGATLGSLAADPGREAYFRSLYRERVQARLGQLSGILEAYGGEPESWATDVREAARRIEATLDSTEAWRPGDWPASGLGDYLAGFGSLLQAWPGIWQAALELGPEFLERSRIKP